jgi:hypothetical protein
MGVAYCHDCKWKADTITLKEAQAEAVKHMDDSPGCIRVLGYTYKDAKAKGFVN